MHVYEGASSQKACVKGTVDSDSEPYNMLHTELVPPCLDALRESGVPLIGQREGHAITFV